MNECIFHPFCWTNISQGIIIIRGRRRDNYRAAIAEGRGFDVVVVVVVALPGRGGLSTAEG